MGIFFYLLCTRQAQDLLKAFDEQKIKFCFFKEICIFLIMNFLALILI
jgi:hypothetical protein